MKKRTKKRILIGTGTLASAAIIAICLYLNSLLPIITGYAAKNLCSAVFVSGRNAGEMENADLNFSFIAYTKNKVDTVQKSVTSRFLWGKSKAVYREGFGSTLIRDFPEENLRRIRFPVNAEPRYSQDTILWPLGNILPDSSTGIDTRALGEISKKVINENAYRGNIYALLVLHKGIPVAEAYKPQFSKSTRFISWSMAKSFTNALVGILVKQGRIDINKPVPIKEWKNDERSKITLNDLMQMQSGLRWNEDYGNRSDVTVMLHCEGDMGKYAYSQPSEYPAGSKWYYSSGTTNIVSYLIRKELGNDSLYNTFVHKELFNKIGMTDAVFEPDASGTIVGSSYLYATARDYGRFGLLCLNKGIFNGERILPEGWMEYSTTAASSSNGGYGAFFWLNRNRRISDAPEDMYSCNGHDGQYIFMLPSQDLVIVLLGYSPSSKGGIDLNNLIKDILATIK